MSSHLIASFWKVARKGNAADDAWKRKGAITVHAPLSEASLEIALNWQSPFENSGTESKAPALMAMLQSGALQPVVDAVGNLFGANKPEGSGMSSDKAKEAADNSNKFLQQFEGRTGITKLNSTQIFTGMPPLKIQVTAIFQAWRDPKTEVEAPFAQLMEWALPEKLSKDGSIIARMIGGKSDEEGGDKDGFLVRTLMPSIAPTRIAMRYKNRLFSPLVIESITFPLQSDVDSNGNYVQLAVPMTLCSLTGIDRQDWVAWGSL